MESRDKSIACHSDQNYVSDLESLREQKSVAGVQNIESSS